MSWRKNGPRSTIPLYQKREREQKNAFGRKGMKIQFIFLWSRPFISPRSFLCLPFNFSQFSQWKEFHQFSFFLLASSFCEHTLTHIWLQWKKEHVCKENWCEHIDSESVSGEGAKWCKKNIKFTNVQKYILLDDFPRYVRVVDEKKNK